MNKIIYIVGAAAVLATLACIGYYKFQHKEPPSTDDIDGGVRINRTDPAAPKNITSTKITGFNCVFSTTALNESYGFEGKVYDLEAKVKDGKVYGYCDYYNRSGEGNKIGFETDVRFMESLYGIVEKYDFAKHNGCSYFVSGLPDMYGAKINIAFASGESIYAYNNQSNFLTADAMRELVNLFEEYTAPEKTADDLVWQSMNIYRNHSVWNQCFNISVIAERDGSMTVRGFCNGPDGHEYSSEEGFALSDEAVLALRQMKLDGLPIRKKKPSIGFQVMDETVQKLILTYADGKMEEKELSDDTLNELFDIVLKEFVAQSDRNIV